VVGQGLGEVISQVPADAKAVGHDLHQLPLAPQAFEEKNKFELEKDYGIDAGATRGGVAILYQFPDERKVELLFQPPIEVVLRD
jgi:hypothetical protein